MIFDLHTSIIYHGGVYIQSGHEGSQEECKKVVTTLCELLQKVSVWQGIAIELKKEKEERKSKQSN